MRRPKRSQKLGRSIFELSVVKDFSMSELEDFDYGLLVRLRDGISEGLIKSRKFQPTKRVLEAIERVYNYEKGYTDGDTV